MKSKPLVFMLLLSLTLPIPTMKMLVADNTNTISSINNDLLKSSSQEQQPYTIVKAQNVLHDERWVKPMETQVVLSNLKMYNKRAMISFFTEEEKENFITEAMIQGVEIDSSLKSIPAVIISYQNSDLNQIDFNNYKIKYTYPIGTYEYTTPANIDMEFPTLVNLAKLREALEIDAIHDLNHTGYGVTVAILDSGLNTSRVPALDGLLNYEGEKVILDITPVPGLEDQADFSGHGTHIATILAGNGKYRDDKGNVKQTDDYGIAPDAQLINIKVLNQTGYGKDEWLIIGFDEAIAQSPDIISASLTSVTFAKTGDPIEELVYEAARNNILIVASAGNYGPSGNSVGAPAIWDHVISVGASDGLDDLAIFSSVGLNQNRSVAVDLLAPGMAIQGSDAEDGGSRWVSGTSVSAPIVSGVLALLVGAYPDLNIHKYEAALLGSTDVLSLPAVYQGNGMINPYAAYTNLTASYQQNMSAIIPRFMDDRNEYYYECVAGETTTFQVKLISSFTGSIYPTLYFGFLPYPENYIDIANQIDIYEGWNHINFSVTIPADTKMSYIQGSIGFEGNTEWPGRYGDSFFINIITRYLGGTVLFDISHENDTANKWFDASTPYGTHMHLARILKDRGFRVRTHSGGAYNFTDVNILVISDPELNFTTQEIDDVYNFVNNGGSLLFLINSIRFIDAESIESSPLISSNYFTCDEFLAKYNLTVWDTVPVDVPYEAFTTDEASMLSVDSFMWWGKMLHFTEENDPNDIVLARLPTITIGTSNYIFDVAVAKEVNEGRIMVFGSGYPFTDHGLLPDSLETSPSRVGLDSSYIPVFNLDQNNLLLVNETFDWLISKHRPKISFESSPEEIFIRQPVDMEVQLRTKYDIIYTTGEPTLEATLLRPGHIIENVVLDFNPTTNKYEFTHTFTEYGEHFLFIPLQLANHTPTDGRIRIFNNVPLWDALPTIETIAIWVTAVIIFSIILTPIFRSRFKKTSPP